MNALDLTIIRFLTSIANRWPAFDALVTFVAASDLVKGGVMMSLLWWAWFDRDQVRAKREGPGLSRQRQVIAATVVACLIAVVVARLLPQVLPFRLRPALALQGADVAKPEFLREQSSFPSDHATLFFTMVVGLLYVSRSVGLLALAYVLVVIGIPRVYLGWHYPTDIIGGMVLGTAICLVAQRARVRAVIDRIVAERLEHRPAWFYSLFFLLSYLIATLFVDLRNFANLVINLLRAG